MHGVVGEERNPKGVLGRMDAVGDGQARAGQVARERRSHEGDAPVAEHDEARESGIVAAKAHLGPRPSRRHHAERLVAGWFVGRLRAAGPPRSEGAVAEREDFARGVESPELDHARELDVPSIHDGPAAGLTTDHAEGTRVARMRKGHGVATRGVEGKGVDRALDDGAVGQTHACERPVPHDERGPVGEGPPVLDRSDERTRAKNPLDGADRTRRKLGSRESRGCFDEPPGLTVPADRPPLDLPGLVGSADDDDITQRRHFVRLDGEPERSPRRSGVERHERASQVRDGDLSPRVHGRDSPEMRGRRQRP